MANIIEIIIKAVDQTGPGVGAASQSLQTLGRDLTRLGTGLTAGLTLPLVGAGLAAINAASDFEESLSKVGVVFGENAGQIESWSTTAATSFGISQQAALESAGTFGNLFTAMGVGLEASTDMSTGLVQLAADLASFNNIDPTVALDKLRAGLTGESEPLKTLGVNLTAAAVEAKAFELGLADANGEISTANLVTARYALIMEQTTTAQGDFARTSDGLANSTRIMKAQLSDAAATLGQALLPIALQVVQGLTGLVNAFNNLSPAGQKAVVVVGAILAAIGPLLLIAGQAITVFSTLAGLFGAGGALAGIGTAMAGIASTAGTALAGLAAAAAPVALPLLAIAGAVALLWATWNHFGPQLVESWGGIFENLGIIATVWWENFKATWAGNWELLKIIITSIDWSGIGAGIIQGLKDGVVGAAQGLIDAVSGAVNSAIAAAKNLLGIQSPSTVFAGLGENVMAGLAKGIQGGVSLPVGALRSTTPQLLAAPGSAVPGGVGGGVTVNVQATVSSQIDVERMAYRIAEVIQLKRALPA